MTYHAMLDERFAGDVASIRGLYVISEWGRSLPQDEYHEITHLFWHGWSQWPDKLRAEFKKALRKNPPKDAGSITVCRAMIATLKSADSESYFYCISDGTSDMDARAERRAAREAKPKGKKHAKVLKRKSKTKKHAKVAKPKPKAKKHAKVQAKHKPGRRGGRRT